VASQNLLRLWCKSGLTFKTHAPVAARVEEAAIAEQELPSPFPLIAAASASSSPAAKEEPHSPYTLTSDPGLDRILGIVRGSKGAKSVVGASGAPRAAAAAAAAAGGSSSSSSSSISSGGPSDSGEAASPGLARGKGRGRGRGRGRARGRGQAGSQVASAIDKDGLLRAQQLLGPLRTLGRAGVKDKWIHPPSGIRVVVQPGELGLDASTICRMERSQEYNDVENRSRIVMDGVMQYRRRTEAAR